MEAAKIMPALSTGFELILNACESTLQIGVTHDEEPLCFQQWHIPKQATEILAPALASIFDNLHLKPAKIRRIACVNGPGSFTGIRLVLATAAALSRVNKAQLAAINYMQALATSLAMRAALSYGTKIYVLTRARRDLVHFQEFVSFSMQIPAQAIMGVMLVKPSIALKSIEPVNSYVCGSALGQYPELFEPVRTGEGPKGAPNARVFPELVNPDWAALRLLARHGDYFHRDLEPFYVRQCDALENVERLAGQGGMTGEELLDRLDEILNRKPD